MQMDQRIPDLSDSQLESLHANAVRLAQSGAESQRRQAESLLPLIGAELERRRKTKALASKERRRAGVERKAVVGQSIKQHFE